MKTGIVNHITGIMFNITGILNTIPVIMFTITGIINTIPVIIYKKSRNHKLNYRNKVYYYRNIK